MGIASARRTARPQTRYSAIPCRHACAHMRNAQYVSTRRARAPLVVHHHRCIAPSATNAHGGPFCSLCPHHCCHQCHSPRWDVVHTHTLMPKAWHHGKEQHAHNNGLALPCHSSCSHRNTAVSATNLGCDLDLIHDLVTISVWSSCDLRLSAVSATKLGCNLDHVEHAALEGNAHGLARWLQEGQRWVEHWDAKAHHPQHQGTV